MIRSPVVCSTSVGRETSLRVLVERLERAITGDGTVVLLGGDAGVGKSRLIRDLKNEATGHRVRIIEGRCSSTESSVPYAPLMDALRFRLARGEGEAAARMLGPLRVILAPVFPQLEGDATAAEHEVERHPDRPFELIFSVFERLAAEEPMLLVLEDVHWADQTSLELLHHLARRSHSLRLLLVATYRSDELHATHPLRRLFGGLGRDRIGVEMRLEPLTREETTEMLRRVLAADPDPAFATAIWRWTEGNPFFVEELLTVLSEAALLEPNAPAVAALERLRLPVTVSEAVLARARAMGPRAFETLSAAAVIGRTFEFDDLCAVLGVTEEELITVIEQLVAHQLLREEPDGHGERYSFPHALMQEAFYESIISRRRRILHRRTAAALERRAAQRSPTRLDELAYHFRLGGEPERAYEYARLAGDEAVRLRAWDDAAAHYEHALASLEQLSDEGPRAAELLERLAGIAWRQSRSAPGRQYAEEALRLRRALGHNEEAARLLRRVAGLRAEEGDTEGATKAPDEGLKLLGDRPESRELGPIYDDLGRLSLAQGDLDRAEALLVHGLLLASRHAEGAEEVLALVSLGELSVVGGRIETGVARLDVALAIMREGRLPFERLARVYAIGVRTLLLAHDYERALNWANAAYSVCREQGVVGLDGLFRALRAAILTITGSEQDTLAEATAAVDDLRRSQRAELRDALRVLGFVHRARGDFEAARRAYEESLSLSERGYSIGLALVCLAEGRIEEAASTLESAFRAVPSDQPLLGRQLLSYTVEALIAAGRVNDAAELVASEPMLPDARAGVAQLCHARGLLRLAEGHPAAAREALAEAVDAWDALGNRLEATRVRIALLEATLTAGEVSEGLGLGRRLLEELGRPLMPQERELVRRILRRAGVRTRSKPREPAADGDSRARLTSREGAVLHHVAQGRTNREIAQALGIAEKTVGVHVSHILAKLGCKTRT
ncbi:MAG: AAA family ATPase, partial [Gemmatimonadaceae bacterium]|nr:AAA family ATPase [Gemmatimonadaceae bacterium]